MRSCWLDFDEHFSLKYIPIYAFLKLFYKADAYQIVFFGRYRQEMFMAKYCFHFLLLRFYYLFHINYPVHKQILTPTL